MLVQLSPAAIVSLAVSGVMLLVLFFLKVELEHLRVFVCGEAPPHLRYLVTRMIRFMGQVPPSIKDVGLSGR